MFLLRIEIAQHHGPSGALSLALSIAALGAANLDTLLEQQYPRFVVQNFNYASSACILAACVVLKSRIYVYKDLDANIIGPIATLPLVQDEFDEDRNTRNGRNLR
jgi:hypothetical protein